MTIEVPGRISTKGDELQGFDQDVLRKRLQRLRSYDFEAITISLINSFSNPIHELLASDIVREEFPDSTWEHTLLDIFISSDYCRE